MSSAMTETQDGQSKPSFEIALEQLQGLVKKLESGELNLEQSLKCFEEGVKLTRLCQEHLGAAEQRIDILAQNSAGRAELQPFSAGKP